MKNYLNTDLSILIIRIATSLLLFYGVHKMIAGHDFVKQILSENGLPEILWIGIPVAEIIAPILLLFGIFTRLSGLTIAMCMLFTLLLPDWGNLLGIDPQVGNLIIDRNLLFMFGGLASFFSGGGKYAIYKPKNDWLK